MKKRVQKMMKNEKGLTLVELLAVIVILGIIAAIAIPAIGNIITNSKVNALKADGQTVLSAAGLYFVENSQLTGVQSTDSVTVTLPKLIEDGFLDDVGGFGSDNTNVIVTKVDKTGNTLVGTAVNNNVSVEFKDATNKNITDAGVKGSTDEVIIVRK